MTRPLVQVYGGIILFISLRVRKSILIAAIATAALGLLVAVLFSSRGSQQSVPTSASPQQVQQKPRTVYLTFDDGPSRNTDALLEVLNEQQVKATFFVTGQNPEYFDCIAKAKEQGHLIALHTYTHNFSSIYSGSTAFWEDIEKLNELIYEQTGEYSNLLRFPGGSSNTVSKRHGGVHIMQTLIAECEQRDIAYVDWNVDTKDAENGTCDADTIFQRAVRGADQVDGDLVILMHDGTANTTAAQATEQVIQYFRDQGCTFDTLDHMEELVHHHLTN